MECIHIEQGSSGNSSAIDILQEVVESKAASLYVHLAVEGFPQWDTLCALENAFIDTNNCEGWTFVVGTIEEAELIHGWLEYEDCIVVPHSPANKDGYNITVYNREDWDELEYHIRAVAPAGPESGSILNAISKSLGHGLLGEDPKNPLGFF